LGALFAVPAAIAVQNAHILAQTQRLADQLQVAVSERGVVDRAIGIIMSRTGVTEPRLWTDSAGSVRTSTSSCR